MDAKYSQPLLIEDVNPESSKCEIDQREEEIDPREYGSASGQIIAGLALTVEIVHSRSNVHRDFELCLMTIGKYEIILISIVVLVKGIEGIGVVEVIEVVNGSDEIGLKSTANLPNFELLKNMEP